jgi:[acyl-carrier-protein] S-malonyltransferase
MSLALVFPGQASQTPGMGLDAAEKYPESRSVFEEADAALGFALSEICFRGSEEELRRTAVTQPSILTTSLAVWAALRERGIRPELVAGHSLGEYSAIVVAGGLSLADAVTTVRLRGEFMQEAVPEGVGAMAAVMGLEAPQVAELCRDQAGGQVLSPANFNGPDQIVISGHRQAVERAVAVLSSADAGKAVMLKVSAPFHCALMEPAQERLAAHLAGLEFRDLEVPLVTNVDAEPIQAAEQVRDSLIRQVSAPVRWTDSMRRMAGLGMSRGLEVGPGKVLTSLQRRIDRSIRFTPVGDSKGVEKALELQDRA